MEQQCSSMSGPLMSPWLMHQIHLAKHMENHDSKERAVRNQYPAESRIQGGIKAKRAAEATNQKGSPASHCCASTLD